MADMQEQPMATARYRSSYDGRVRFARERSGQWGLDPAGTGRIFSASSGDSAGVADANPPSA
jgi:hypothetical protein